MDHYSSLDAIIDAFERFVNDIEIDDKIIEKDELNYLLKDRYEKLLINDRLEEICEKICRDYYNGKHNRKSTIMSRLRNDLSFKLDIFNVFNASFVFVICSSL